MIKNILFDMGQLLIKFEPLYFIKREGISDSEDTKILLREIYQSKEWPMMDRGRLTEEEMVEIVKKRIPERLHKYLKRLICEWFDPIEEIEGMYDVVKGLKKNGYKLILLSNASYKQKDYWLNIPCHVFFDERVVSSEVKLCKPQPEIFKYVLDKYNLKPEETVFMDDSISNCEAADYVGINAIVFHGDVQELIAKYKELGVKVD